MGGRPEDYDGMWLTRRFYLSYQEVNLIRKLFVVRVGWGVFLCLFIDVGFLERFEFFQNTAADDEKFLLVFLCSHVEV